jgi:hypothetical protein
MMLLSASTLISLGRVAVYTKALRLAVMMQMMHTSTQNLQDRSCDDWALGTAVADSRGVPPYGPVCALAAVLASDCDEDDGSTPSTLSSTPIN